MTLSDRILTEISLKAWLLLLFLLLAFPSLHAQKQDGYFGDSTLYVLSMQMYDSIKSPSFFEMQQRGLRQAVEKKNAHFDYVFRVGLVSHYDMLRDKENFLKACDEVIRHYQTQKDDSLLYEVWERVPDRLQVWGDYAESILELRRMAAYAQQQNHPIGMAVADFCFAQSYLNNGQTDEAEHHYRLALSRFTYLGMPGKVTRCGFNLISIRLQHNDLDGALALSDSLPRHIRAWEVGKGIAINPVLRMKQAMYRLKILIGMKNLPEATVQRDSMLYYNKVYADASQQEEMQYTLARYERLAGNYPESERILKMLIAYNRRSGNQVKLARYYRMLAEVKRSEKQMADAADYFHLYSLASDSAQTATSNRQLNQLTKLYRLNELEQENRIAEAERKEALILAVSVAAVAGLIIVICILLYIHSRRLHRKNKELVARIRSQEEAEERVEEVRTRMEAAIPEEELSKETVLFRQIQALLADEQVLSRAKLGRDELAALLNTNRTYVADAISACAGGRSVSQYVAAVRVKRARQLLDHNPEMSLEDIGIACGFQSQGTFTKYYRNYYDITPGEYRKLAAVKL